MKRKLFVIGSMSVTLCLLLVSFASAASLVAHSQGGVLSGAPDYDWWHGCSPTSAGRLKANCCLHLTPEQN